MSKYSTKFETGDRAIIKGKEENILKVVEVEGWQVKLRKGNEYSLVYAEFWKNEAELEYPTDQQFWSVRQVNAVEESLEEESLEEENLEEEKLHLSRIAWD